MTYASSFAADLAFKTLNFVLFFNAGKCHHAYVLLASSQGEIVELAK